MLPTSVMKALVTELVSCLIRSMVRCKTSLARTLISSSKLSRALWMALLTLGWLSKGLFLENSDKYSCAVSI